MPLLWPEALRVRLFSLKQAYVQVCRSAAALLRCGHQCSKSSLDLRTYTLLP